MPQPPNDHHRSVAAFEARAKIVEDAGGLIDAKAKTLETADIARDYGPMNRMDPGVTQALAWFASNGFTITVHGTPVQ